MNDMYKHIEDPERCVGKILEKLSNTNETVIITFTDKTYIRMETEMDNYDDFIIIKYKSFDFVHGYPSMLAVDSGVMTRVEHTEACEKFVDEIKRNKDREERRNYEILRKKFEVKS